MIIIETFPYVLVFFIVILGIKYNNKTTDNIIFFSLFIFSALRYEIGYDFLEYIQIITQGPDYSIERLELGERKLVLLSRNTFTQVFFIINSFISVYFTKYALNRLSPNIAISALAFFCFPNMYLYSFGVVRYWSAIAVVFFASSFLKDKKYILYLIFQILALFLHNAAIVGILFFPLYKIRIPYILNIIILFCGFIGGEYVLGHIISGLFPENIYSDQLVKYANADVGSGNTKIPYLFLIFDVFLFISCRKLLKKSKEFYLFVTIYNIGVTLMFLFSFQSTLSIRLSLPFLLYSIIIIAYIMQNKINVVFTKRSKLLVFESCCFIMLMYTITIFNGTLGKSQYLPYKLFFLE